MRRELDAMHKQAQKDVHDAIIASGIAERVLQFLRRHRSAYKDLSVEDCLFSVKSREDLSYVVVKVLGHRECSVFVVRRGEGFGDRNDPPLEEDQYQVVEKLIVDRRLKRRYKNMV